MTDNVTNMLLAQLLLGRDPYQAGDAPWPAHKALVQRCCANRRHSRSLRR